jgi:putative Holliday junction resolvase
VNSDMPLRTMALDVGDKRIGIAVTDALGMTVQGRPTRRRKNLSADVEYIRALVEEDGVVEVVVGHPLHMDGARSRQTEKTEAFAEHLRTVLPVPVVYWDERLTSFDAEERLEEMGLGWRKRREHVDELAATLILEDYLRQRA